MAYTGLKVVSAIAGGAALIATLTFGPIDLMRTVGNAFAGDAQGLKSGLIGYVKRDIQREHPYATLDQIEFSLARDLGTDLYNREKIDPSDVSITTLWDMSEDRARSWWQRWFWPDLEE